MARILDKLVPSTAQRTIKLRQKYDWIKTELNEMPGLYESKKQLALDKFIIKANKKLSSAAYAACDKTEYAGEVMEKKLQEYDVKKYLSHRAANHKAAKAIFKAIKSGVDWSMTLTSLKTENTTLLQDRKRYVEKLEAQKSAFIAKNSSSDSSAYNSLYKQLEAEYNNLCATIDEKHNQIVEKKRQTLEKKLGELSSKIEENRAKSGNRQLPDDILLSVKGLKMYFGGLRAVDDLTFDVKKGEIFGLIGPNGAGKTTVFNCITRFYDATGGEMYFENKYGEVVDLRNYKVHDIILQGISRTFQNIELVKEVSVLENLLVAGTRAYRSGLIVHALGLPLLKKEDKIMRQKAMRILKFMGLESYANWLAFGLPYGILKKVEIARALMADAKLIIMDEPAAGLNDSETAELTETIRRIRDEFGVTILLVEHDMGLVMNVCDTVCAISFGQMLAIGTTEEIQKNKTVQEAYLGVEEDE
jgi:branched-chain amino acid transport system ATP-binding protein